MSVLSLIERENIEKAKLTEKDSCQNERWFQWSLEILLLDTCLKDRPKCNWLKLYLQLAYIKSMSSDNK